MLTSTFILKLILAPLIIAFATLIARRWGDAIGGLVIGLPLTSAPVSIFFYIEQGPQFAQRAAKGAMLGMIPVAVFCLGYVFSSARISRLQLPWYGAAAAGIGCYALAVTGMSKVDLPLWETLLAVVIVLVAALFLVGRPGGEAVKVAPPRFDLPLRMVLATAMLLFVTTAASALGPVWSGLLSPFPIFTFVMSTFAHSQSGASAAWRVIRGVLAGLFAYTAFFLVVGLLVLNASPVLTYALAACVALAINGASLFRIAGVKSKITDDAG